MCVLSNNSPKEIGIFKASKNAPDHIVKILTFLEEIIREFIVTVKIQRNSTAIMIQDKKSKVQGESLRIIALDVFTRPKSYSMNLYHRTNDSKNSKHVYEIKVKGDYELKTLKTNLEKLIQGKNLTHRPRFYPF